jgi:3-deoxy-D-manno-octulosonic-acid transferase
MRLIYLILMTFAAPVAAFVAWRRGLTNSERRESLADRFGRTQITVSKPVLWVHAASMGEVQAGVVLIKRLLAQYPSHQIVVTTQTTTGAARVRAVFGDQVQHCFLPYDLPIAVNEFLNRLQPNLALILETELWPNLLRACRQRGIPIVIASARISPRSFERYRKLASLFKPVLSHDVVIAAQTAEDAARFKFLGAGDVRTMGNIKFDIDIPEAARASGSAFRALNANRFIWVAGSTHSSEEEATLAAHRRLLQAHPSALLVLVPRHPQRFDDVRALLARSGLNYVARSSNATITSETSVLLVDTMGELLSFYAAADVAFVGGSLAPVGGHNLLEPAALSVPILAGPHLSNAQDIADRMLAAGAARCVKSTEALGDAILKWAGDAQARLHAGRRGAEVVNANRGAVDRVMALIEERVRPM